MRQVNIEFSASSFPQIFEFPAAENSATLIEPSSPLAENSATLTMNRIFRMIFLG